MGIDTKGNHINGIECLSQVRVVAPHIVNVCKKRRALTYGAVTSFW